jgi:ParB/Sulfiredoxin domain
MERAVPGSGRAEPDVPGDEPLVAPPDALRAAYGPERWRREDLWSLDLPRVRLALPELTWLLDLPLWQRDGVRFQVSPNEVLRNPADHPQHARRIDAADLTRPIHVMRREGRWTVLDGHHRLAAAVRRQHTAIDAWLVSAADLAAITR